MSMFDASIYHENLRDYILSSQKKELVVARDLWSLNNNTYTAYRRYLTRSGHSYGLPAASHPPGKSEQPKSKAAVYADKYTFSGMQHILDPSRSAITVLSFAHVRNDLLAFANADGDMWIVLLQGALEPRVVQAQKVHQKAISCIDWSFDNSHLLSCALDGSLCVFSVADGSCSRSVLLIKPTNCCKFFPLNPNIALLGNAQGELEIYNCSTGAMLQHYKLLWNGLLEWGLQVTALECASTTLFVGDSSGYVHVYKIEMARQQIRKLVWVSRLRASKSKGSILSLQYGAFCGETGSPFLLVTCQDTTVAMLSVDMEEHKLSKVIRVRVFSPTTTFPSPSLGVRAAMCPLSCIDSLPLFTMGGGDTTVNLYAFVKGQKTPMLVNPLQGHSAAVMTASWSFDESLMVSADASGMVIVWRRQLH